MLLLGRGGKRLVGCRRGGWRNDNLEMSVEDQKATFNLFEAIKHLSDNKTCFKVEAIEQEVDLAGKHLKSVFLE